jgi:zinc metalloprotease ZmpB
VSHTAARALIVGVLAGMLLVAAGAAVADKPGPGTSAGTGSVFVSNPVEDLGDQSLRDEKDSAAAVPAAAYHTVALNDLDGTGFLRGRWAEIVSETGSPAYSPTNSFFYDRSQDEFEQVMGYFWITESQRYIQSLGFGSSLRPVNMEPQRLRINQWGADNSFATTHKDEIRLGKGGVDDAEDGEVITHEYGHAIHFSQNFVFGSAQAGAISEGFGDYWAVTTTQVVRAKLGLPPLSDPACVADWDATSYDPTPPHCLRRVDSNLHYPENLTGAVHSDGRIWSRALWDIRNAIGHVKADTVILEGQFDFPGTTMPVLAQRTVAAAQRLYGASTANAVRRQFEARGIL